MTDYFFDSSALIKRYVSKTGTTWIRSLTTPHVGDTIFIAYITQVEIVSGAARLRREGQISSRNAHAIRLVLNRHAEHKYVVIRLGEHVVERAQDLLEKYMLRAYDSVQLASALEANRHLLAAGMPPLIFISADHQLLTAATAEGFTVDDPNLHP